MSGYRKYALFDWDNTIRRGYTLYSWVEYLHQCNITSIHLQKKLEILKQQYIKSEITHDQYANKACAEYAKDLAGKKVNEINVQQQGARLDDAPLAAVRLKECCLRQKNLCRGSLIDLVGA